MVLFDVWGSAIEQCSKKPSRVCALECAHKYQGAGLARAQIRGMPLLKSRKAYSPGLRGLLSLFLKIVIFSVVHLLLIKKIKFTKSKCKSIVLRGFFFKKKFIIIIFSTSTMFSHFMYSAPHKKSPHLFLPQKTSALYYASSFKKQCYWILSFHGKGRVLW